jgi:2,3-bisphosphoglycerate-dependent phosphoglycerate mutase
MQFYLIRHGQSVNNLLYATTGSSNGRDCDPELTALGSQQAELLAEYMYQEEFHLNHLYTSLMVRAVSTGTVVADRLGLPLIAWPDLYEEGGIYLTDAEGNRIGQPGKDRSYFEKNYPRLVLPESLDASGWWNRPFENSAERPFRTRRFLQELFSRHCGADQCIAVISHGGFYNQVLRTLLNLTNELALWFNLNNTAITRFDFYPDRTEFVYHNRIHFLPKEMIT